MRITDTAQSLFPPPSERTTTLPPMSAVRPVTVPPPSSRGPLSQPPPSSRLLPPIPMTVADALLTIVRDEGVDHIFGVPGASLTPIYEAISRNHGIRHVLAKHEAGAAFMAAGYARVKRGLGVCCATTGPGATNAVTGIASAYADSLPVLLLTGQSSTRFFGKGAFQESSAFGIDIVQLFKPITKLSTMVPSPERFAELLQHAIRVALSGRPGPVHLSLPADFLHHMIEVARRTPSQYRAAGATLDRQAVATVAEHLIHAEQPAILVGHGASLADASPELMRLAERLHIPIATSPKAKGVFPENHPLSLGVFGFAGHPRAEDYLLSGQVDVLLVIGTSLGEWTTNTWTPALMPSRAFLQIDIDPNVLGRNYPIDVGVVGDAKAALHELDEQVEQLIAAGGSVARDHDPLAITRLEVPRYLDLEGLDDRPPIKPQHLVQDMQAALPDDALVFVDIGNAMTWAGHYLESRVPNTYIVSLGLASMGSALAGAIGGKLAAPGRVVVALVGDGAFAMSGLEVHTAVDHHLPIVWIVLNNGGHGMIRHGERLLLGDHLNACEFHARLDIQALAESIGARAFRVDSREELRRAMAEAVASGTCSVIDAHIDPDVVPCSLARRARAVKASFDQQVPRAPKAHR